MAKLLFSNIVFIRKETFWILFLNRYKFRSKLRITVVVSGETWRELLREGQPQGNGSLMRGLPSETLLIQPQNLLTMVPKACPREARELWSQPPSTALTRGRGDHHHHLCWPPAQHRAWKCIHLFPHRACNFCSSYSIYF